MREHCSCTHFYLSYLSVLTSSYLPSSFRQHSPHHLTFQVPSEIRMPDLLDLNIEGIRNLSGQSFTPDPTFPRSEKSYTDYDVNKLMTRVDYAKELKRRNISPRTASFATEYLEVCELALAAEENRNTSIHEYGEQDLRERVHQLDRHMEHNQSLWYIPNKAMQTLCDNTCRLRKIEFYMRYGDYLSKTLKELKSAAKGPEHQSAFRKYWSTIASNIRKERESKLQEDNKPKDTPTIEAVESCASVINIPPERIFWAIEAYSTRNCLAHSDLDPLIHKGQFWQVANKLHEDLEDIKALSPQDDDIASIYMEFLVWRIVRQLFNVRKGDEDDPGTWVPTDLALSMRPKDEDAEAAVHKITLQKFKEKTKMDAEKDFLATLEREGFLHKVPSNERMDAVWKTLNKVTANRKTLLESHYEEAMKVQAKGMDNVRKRLQSAIETQEVLQTTMAKIKASSSRKQSSAKVQTM